MNEFNKDQEDYKIRNFKLIMYQSHPNIIREYLTALRGRTDDVSRELVRLAEERIQEM